MDEFEDMAFVVRPSMRLTAEGDMNSRKRSALARVVSRVYRAANDAVRADMLLHLLRPLGMLGLVAVASGAFARLARRDGMMPDTISAEDMVRYSSEQIRELTLFVHEVNPDALQPLVEQLAQSGMGIAALSTAALVMLHHKSRGKNARLGMTASSTGSAADAPLCIPVAAAAPAAAPLSPRASACHDTRNRALGHAMPQEPS